MLEFYEKQAHKIKKLEPWLTIAGIGLFISTLFGLHMQFEKAAHVFTFITVLFWVCGLAFLGHMFSPAINEYGESVKSKVRVSSDLKRAYSLTFVTCWFIFLSIFSIRVIWMYF